MVSSNGDCTLWFWISFVFFNAREVHLVLSHYFALLATPDWALSSQFLSICKKIVNICQHVKPGDHSKNFQNASLDQLPKTRVGQVFLFDALRKDVIEVLRPVLTSTAVTKAGESIVPMISTVCHTWIYLIPLVCVSVAIRWAKNYPPHCILRVMEVMHDSREDSLESQERDALSKAELSRHQISFVDHGLVWTHSLDIIPQQSRGFSSQRRLHLTLRLAIHAKI